MWTIAQYQPTALFSLRPHTATSSGGKSLITPTPFAIKTALLDIAIRTQGLAYGERCFSSLHSLEIALQLPAYIVVNNTFTKILRIKEIKTKASEKEAGIAKAIAQRQWPYQNTINFREYVQFGGKLALAFQGMMEAELLPLLANLNYLGKRGSFMQLCHKPETVETLPDSFTKLTTGFGDSFPLGTLQDVDDWGPKLTFERLNVYSDKPMSRGHRVFHQVILPVRPVRSSRGYTLYERIDRD